ncbi:hypothetical protein [Rosettibacter firmus]|uniref:hypothetical protein n=1 Tax=Rosettibacter firmus TaxID=3111522 RepID=UPI00336C17DB
MSLRKLKNIPKIPKTRKKKPATIIASIPLKKPDKLEFYCRAYFKYDPKLKKQFTAFLIETSIEFTNFFYEVSAELVQEKNVLYIVITGLVARMDKVPEVSPARKEILLDVLSGIYTINVVKQDGAINSAEFDFDIINKKIQLIKEFIPKKKNNRFFCKFEVAKENFTFPESY